MNEVKILVRKKTIPEIMMKLKKYRAKERSINKTHRHQPELKVLGNLNFQNKNIINATHAKGNNNNVVCQFNTNPYSGRNCV